MFLHLTAPVLEVSSLFLLCMFSYICNLFQDISNCEKAPLSGFAGPDGTQPLCYVTSKEDGSFVFPSLPVGEFYVVSMCCNGINVDRKTMAFK